MSYIDDQFSKSRNEQNGRCFSCNLLNTNPSWCQTCDPQKLLVGWSSGNQEIDKLIQETQLMAVAYNESYLEWIPYDDLDTFVTIGDGDNIIDKAVWTTGERTILKTSDGYIRARSKPIDVVTKLLAKSCEFLTPEIFKHLRIHYSCQIKIPKHIIKFYGLTQNPKKEVLMVMRHASHGDLGTYLRSNYRDLKWTEKLDILSNFSEGLSLIHKNDYLHRNFQSSNILQMKEDNNDPKIKILITDFSLSTKLNESIPSESFFGTLPYVAPEVLCAKPFTASSDVYSLGIIMTELSSGKVPYDDRTYDCDLALSIVSTGLRPVFREATPQIFINLAIECLNPNPEKRPTSETIASIVKKWKEDLDSKEDSNIKKKFLDSDKLLRAHKNSVIENQASISRSFYNKSFDFKNLPDHSSCKPPRTRIIRSDSKQVDLVIPDVIANNDA